MQYAITSNAIDFTKSVRSPGRERVLPFPSMAVGDGFPLPVDRKKANSIMASACDFVRKSEPNWKFSKRTDADGNKWCVRIK